MTDWNNPNVSIQTQVKNKAADQTNPLIRRETRDDVTPSDPNVQIRESGDDVSIADHFKGEIEPEEKYLHLVESTPAKRVFDENGVPIVNRKNALNEIYRSDLQVDDKEPVPQYNSKEDMIASNEDVFKGIGMLNEKYAYDTELMENARPVKMKNRRVSKELWKPFKEELDKMEENLILAKLLDETSDWENSFVLVIKDNGSLRFCLDPTRLNPYIRRPTHYTKN